MATYRLHLPQLDGGVFVTGSDRANDDLRRGPKWRTRTSPRARHRAAVVWFVPIVAVGAAIMFLVILLLDRLGAPGWLATMPWWLPTLAALVWATLRPAPAVVSDDDDDSWAGYVIRFVLVGEGEPREPPLRAITAVVFGAPVVWSLLVFGVLVLLGLG